MPDVLYRTMDDFVAALDAVCRATILSDALHHEMCEKVISVMQMSSNYQDKVARACILLLRQGRHDEALELAYAWCVATILSITESCCCTDWFKKELRALDMYELEQL